MLLIDDWAMAPLNESERRDFWEICDNLQPKRGKAKPYQVKQVRHVLLKYGLGAD